MKTKTLLSIAAAAVILSACSAATNSAPVVSGNGTAASPYDGSTAAANPYNAAPYTPNSAPAATPYTPSTPSAATHTPSGATAAMPYTPPASSGSAYSHPTGVYPPVDANATFHTVVAGDTLYNIAKRYHVSQDNIRMWNNMPDNTVKLGQSLRVKPTSAGGTASTSYSGGSSATGSYRVVAGDTLFGIARNHGMTAGQLRALNNLTDDNVKIGQVLRVSGSNTAAATPAPAPYTPPPSTPAAPAPAASSGISGKTITRAGLTWQSPLPDGSIAQAFTEKSRGVELLGASGQNVVAAADGQVIYSGNGPRGYGRLVVVQHTPQLLTAYSGGETLLAKEQQRVKRGHAIATLGGSGKLHLEVRENGKPVNPGSYIPF